MAVLAGLLLHVVDEDEPLMQHRVGIGPGQQIEFQVTLAGHLPVAILVPDHDGAIFLPLHGTTILSERIA